ncbi:MAG: CRISPR system precrRNA processing endoribonuclease RAMP protein Cas6 [Syntrophobacteraceae bacterium]
MFERFRLSIEVRSLMVLPPYKGAVFRGAFGNAFRRVVCAVPRVDCAVCMLRQRCLYVSIFEPPPPASYPDAAKFSQAPPPYVLNPPLTNRQAFHPGDSLDFELVLIGPAIEALPYFIYTFTEMGKRGLGRERGRYALACVDLVRGEESIRVYDGAAQMLTAYPLNDYTQHQPEENGVSDITLHFLTPLRLKVKGDLVTQLTFPVLFERLAQRLILLTAFYGSGAASEGKRRVWPDSPGCGGPPPAALPDFSPLLTLAQSIVVTNDELHWYDWERYSARQKETMKYGGLRGNMTISGNVAPLLPCLRLGEVVNVGQATTFGLGRFKMEVIP